MIKVCLFLVYIACIYNCARARFLNNADYSKHSNEIKDRKDCTEVVVIRQRSGSDMNLKCNLVPCRNQTMVWDFKRCEQDSKMMSCTHDAELTTENSKWIKLTEHATRKKCSAYLVLQDLSMKNVGFYRCTIDSNIIKMFRVEVIESLSKYVEQPPELLTIFPSNITISQNMQFIIQCKVYSKQPPAIWWFKQTDGFNYDIQYFDKYYNRINTTVQVYPVPQEANVYLSKLNVYHAKDIDSGVYVCLAMTESGKDFKDAVVHVISTKQIWELHSSLFLLFLIPITFALIPITAWLWYYKKKSKTKREIKFKSINQQEHLIRPILCDNNILLTDIKNVHDRC